MSGAPVVCRHQARIIRPTGRNTFAVVFDKFPGISEVHFSTIEAGDRREFNRAILSLPSLLGRTREQCVPVSVDLGKYCLGSRSWVDCTLYFPACQEKNTPDRLC